MTKLVYGFAEGGRDMKDLLGGKGANLAEMTALGLPVPPGFVITTEACRAYRASGDLPPELSAEVDEHLSALEAQMGKRLGDAADLGTAVTVCSMVFGNLVGSYDDLCDLMALAARGAVRLHTATYALDDFQSALDDLEAGRVRGRAILVP